MKITLATLADAANISQEGKLNVTGIFQNIYMESTPALFAKMVLAFMCDADAEDLGREVALSITMIDPDANVLVDATQHITFDPSNIRSRHTSLITFDMFQLPAFGDYEIVLRSETEAVSVRFFVMPLPKQALGF